MWAARWLKTYTLFFSIVPHDAAGPCQNFMNDVLDAVEVRFRQFGMRSVIEGYVTGRTTVLVVSM